MIEFEKKLQGAEEFEKLSQQLAQEIKKLKSRYNCLENALIETTGKLGGNVERYFKVCFSAKYEKLSSLLSDQKKTDKKLLPKIQFLQVFTMSETQREFVTFNCFSGKSVANNSKKETRSMKRSSAPSPTL
jgi:hypothetical protein